jgi:hypothetical protein
MLIGVGMYARSNINTLMPIIHANQLPAGSSAFVAIWISDLNPDFKGEGLLRLADYIIKKDLKNIGVVPSGTLQIDTIALNEKLKQPTKKLGVKELKRKSQDLERATLSKVLNAFYELKADAQLLRVKAKASPHETPLTVKEKMQVEEKKSVKNRLKTAKVVSDKIQEVNLTNFILDPSKYFQAENLGSPSARMQKKRVLFFPWSAITAENSQRHEYVECAKEFKLFLAEEKNEELFGELVTKASKYRLQHLYDKLDSSEDADVWFVNNMAIAKEHIGRYFKNEIPFFLMHLKLAKELFEKTGEATYVCYPTENPMMHLLMDFVDRVAKAQGYTGRLTFVDITDVLRKPTKSTPVLDILPAAAALAPLENKQVDLKQEEKQDEKPVCQPSTDKSKLLSPNSMFKLSQESKRRQVKSPRLSM